MTSDRVWIVVAVAAALLVGALVASSAFTQWIAGIVGPGTETPMPDLDDPATIRRGAGHYDRFCARCHASPERPQQADDVALSPSPPVLHQRLDGWAPEHLFRIAKHGVPESGMPAWPVQDRDDEVWAMVAFLRVLPRLDAGSYAGLARAADLATVETALAECVRCHGVDGRGASDGAFPRLDIQTPEYLYETLLAFRDGPRSSGIMLSAVSGLDDEELKALAAYFGRRVEVPAAPADYPLSPSGAGTKPLPSCAACHGPPAPARPEFPSLTGQYEPYLRSQLMLFIEGRRGGGDFVGLMHKAATALTEAEARALAQLYSAMGSAE